MKKKSIWIVDDDSIFKIIIQKIISKSEIFEHVKTFSNGEEAFLTLKNSIENNNQLPDIILLDIEMPIMDGWDFMNKINNYKENLGIKIYMSSSSIAKNDKIRAEQNPNIKGFLTKPISLDDLVEVAS